MQKFILIALALLVATVIAQQDPAKDKNEYQKPVITPKTCPRSLDVNFSNGKKTIIVNANVGSCGKDDKKRMAKMQFTMSSVGIPRVSVNSQKAKDDKAAALRLGFAIDRVVEYTEKNGVQGFQPGEDTVVQTYKLGSTAWSDITVVKNDIDATNSVYDLSTTLTGQTYASQVKLSVSVTPIEIAFRVQNTTVQRTVLTPNSFKVSFAMNGIKYSASNSTGLSVGVVLASKGSMGKRPATRAFLVAAQTASEITTDTVSTDQEVHDIEDEADPNSKAAFFSLKKFVFKYTPAGALSSTTVPVATSAASFKEVTDSSEKGELNSIQSEGSDLNLKRMWFTPLEKVTDFVWDPTIGSNEGSTSSASAAKISFMVLFASFLVALLFL